MTSKLDGYVGWATQMARHQVRIRLCFQNFPSQVGLKAGLLNCNSEEGREEWGAHLLVSCQPSLLS